MFESNWKRKSEVEKCTIGHRTDLSWCISLAVCETKPNVLHQIAFIVAAAWLKSIHFFCHSIPCAIIFLPASSEMIRQFSFEFNCFFCGRLTFAEIHFLLNCGWNIVVIFVRKKKPKKQNKRELNKDDDDDGTQNYEQNKILAANRKKNQRKMVEWVGVLKSALRMITLGKSLSFHFL